MDEIKLTEVEKEVLDMEKSFTNQKPSGKEVEAIESLRNLYKDLARAIIVICPHGSNYKDSMRFLKRSLMYTVASIVLDRGEK